jgi:hypothetical protein
MQMVGQRTPVRRAVTEINSELAEKGNVAEAINQLLHQVQAARRDLYDGLLPAAGGSPSQD